MADDTLKVLVVDDHPVTRVGICTVLESAPDIKVVGVACNGREAEGLVRKLRPDILLLDLILPDRPPFEVERWVRRHYPETITLILTAHDRDAFLSRAVQRDVSGYLTKEQAVPHLVAAIRRAAAGECLLTNQQLRRAHRWQTEVGACLEKLTDREQEVLTLLGQGLDNTGIAEHLELSIHTVRAHCRHIYKKLGVSNRTEAATFARELDSLCT